MIVGSFGTALGVFGTATQVNETLQTISLIITIVGAIITYIIVPILAWYIKAKKDGKIDADEIKEGVEIIKDGTDKVKSASGKNDEPR